MSGYRNSVDENIETKPSKDWSSTGSNLMYRAEVTGGFLLVAANVASILALAGYGTYKAGAAMLEERQDPIRIPESAALVYQKPSETAWSVPAATADAVECGDTSKGFGLIKAEHSKTVKDLVGAPALKLVVCGAGPDQSVEHFKFSPVHPQ